MNLDVLYEGFSRISDIAESGCDSVARMQHEGALETELLKQLTTQIETVLAGIYIQLNRY